MKKVWFRIGQVVSLVGFVVLLFMVIYGVFAHNIIDDGNVMLSVFWGRFTFYDIYVAFLVFFVWVVIREKSIWKSAVWFVLIMGGGSMTICLYLFIAITTSEFDLNNLLLGKQTVIQKN